MLETASRAQRLGSDAPVGQGVASPLPPARHAAHDGDALLAAGVDLYAVARILRHSDPRVTFETYAHLVPAHLRRSISCQGSKLLLHQCRQRLRRRSNPRRGTLLDRSDSRDVRVARLEGVEPPTRGFEGRCSIQLSYRRVRAIVPCAEAPECACGGVVCLSGGLP